MTAPLVTIQNTLISRLENITLTNGYAFDIETVAFDDRDRNDWNPAVRDIIIVEGAEEYSLDYSCPQGAAYGLGLRTEFEINGFFKQLDTDTTEPGVVDKNVTRFAMKNAIVKAIVNSDPSGFQTMGTPACKHFEWVRFERLQDAGFDVLQVVVAMYYRVKENDHETGA